MSKSIYWCNSCEIPIIEKSICPRCGAKCKSASTNGICNPVFYQEKKLLSAILNEPVEDENVWYIGSSQYLIDGKRTKLPYIEFFKAKKHLLVAEELRSNIDNQYDIPRKAEFVEANANYLGELVFEAEQYVVDLKTRFIDDGTHMPTVSFSGGKDSTVVSRLVRDALQDESVIHYFGDTTLEFPCTYHYVQEEFRVENPFTPLLPSETNKDFFKLCNVFGPPSKFERWCCTIFKTGTLNTEYQNLVGNSLTFLGIRHSESRERKGYERTQDHSKIGTQINAMPIIEWDDCDVWLYLLAKDVRFNEAYLWGYKRVGCWCCPNNSDWSTMLTDIYFPDLASRWRAVLYDFAEKTNKTDIDDYVENGKWKTRKGASGLVARNVAIADTPCNLSDRARNIIIQKKIQRDVLEFIKPFGELSIFDKEDATYITVTERAGNMIAEDGKEVSFPRRKVCDLVITWGTPVLKVLPTKSTDIQLLVNRLKCQMRKYQYCIRCSACDSVCPNDAINTFGNVRYAVDEAKCPQNMNLCSRCIAKFYNGCITCQVLADKKKTEDEDAF